MEVKRVMQNSSGLADSVVCMREASFQQDARFQAEVPEQIKQAFNEANEEGRASVRKVKKELENEKGADIIRYPFLAVVSISPRLCHISTGCE